MGNKDFQQSQVGDRRQVSRDGELRLQQPQVPIAEQMILDAEAMKARIIDTPGREQINQIDLVRPTKQ